MGGGVGVGKVANVRACVFFLPGPARARPRARGSRHYRRAHQLFICRDAELESRTRSAETAEAVGGEAPSCGAIEV